MRRISYLLYIFVHFACIYGQATPSQDGLPNYGMQKFVSRPDIECPKWKVQIYDEDAVSPGYWFVSPYEKNGNRLPGGSWIGPHIFDGNGELIWSGTHLFNHINVMDFKVSNVNGTDMLSMLFAVEGKGYILDNHYQVREKVDIGITGETLNMHDFRTIENGSHYLYLKRNVTEMSKEKSLDLGYKDGLCQITYSGFEERDIQTGKVLYTWQSENNIPFSDSTMDDFPLKDRCLSHWDYLHSNAIDKFADGHYLISTRHSDTLYKISKDDGSIIWRLHGHGGARSDFEMGNLNFSRQHHARIREQNETHTIISFLDNALGADYQPATSSWTRALLVALRTDVVPMTAEIIRSYDHPHKAYAFRRGSYQVLPNGHAFVGWSEQALQSEHAPDGRLLMEAEFESKAIGTYRAFKQPFVGDPLDPPDLHSAAFNTGSSQNGTSTLVYMSWNGATEVANWRLYKTNAMRGPKLLVGTVPRSGFETTIQYDGYASYVFVEAVDRYGKTLGKSDVFKTLPADDMSTAAVAEEMKWLNDTADVLDGEDDDSLTVQAQFILTDPVATFISGAVTATVIFAVILVVKRRGLPWHRGEKRHSYEPVAAEDAADYDETQLDDISTRAKEADRESLEFVLAETDEDDNVGRAVNGRTTFARQVSGV